MSGRVHRNWRNKNKNTTIKGASSTISTPSSTLSKSSSAPKAASKSSFLTKSSSVTTTRNNVVHANAHLSSSMRVNRYLYRSLYRSIDTLSYHLQRLHPFLSFDSELFSFRSKYPRLESLRYFIRNEDETNHFTFHHVLRAEFQRHCHMNYTNADTIQLQNTGFMFLKYFNSRNKKLSDLVTNPESNTTTNQVTINAKSQPHFCVDTHSEYSSKYSIPYCVQIHNGHHRPIKIIASKTRLITSSQEENGHYRNHEGIHGVPPVIYPGDSYEYSAAASFDVENTLATLDGVLSVAVLKGGCSSNTFDATLAPIGLIPPMPSTLEEVGDQGEINDGVTDSAYL